MHKHYTWSKGW